jgi:hypothetical protein
VWFFFSVAFVAASVLIGWRWYLNSRPQQDYEKLVSRLDVVEQVAQKAQKTANNLSMNRTIA